MLAEGAQAQLADHLIQLRLHVRPVPRGPQVKTGLARRLGQQASAHPGAGFQHHVVVQASLLQQMGRIQAAQATAHDDHRCSVHAKKRSPCSPDNIGLPEYT